MGLEVSAALALALGKPVDGRELSWPLVLQIARRERCAALGWFRSAATIRDLAPAEVSAEWRREALSAISLAEFWAAVIAETCGQLAEARAGACVLKGLPLSRRLYGSDAARPCSDLDLYIPADRRATAHQRLLAAGWTWRIGTAPAEAGYTRDYGERTALLEVHSHLLDDALVAHLPFVAPTARKEEIGGISVEVHDDAQLPGFLATHLAKHAMPPLLWFIDLHELWSALPDAERTRAARAARGARASRYLDWARARSRDLVAAADFDPAGLRALGLTGASRVDGHNAFRVATLAGGPVDALRVAAGWLAPRHVDREWSAVRRLLIERVVKAARGAVARRRSYRDTTPAPAAAQSAPRAIACDAGEFHSIARELSSHGARFTIRATGSSMRPSLAPGTSVVLAPCNRRPISVGDVVLVRTDRGTYLLHRVCAAGAGWVQTQGDANSLPDAPVSREAVTAIAESMLVDGAERPIPRARIVRARRIARRCLRRLGSWPAKRARLSDPMEGRPTSAR